MKEQGHRERPIQKLFWINESENQAIRRKMGEAGIRNFSTFARYMLLTGRVQVINFEERRSQQRGIGCCFGEAAGD